MSSKFPSFYFLLTIYIDVFGLRSRLKKEGAMRIKGKTTWLVGLVLAFPLIRSSDISLKNYLLMDCITFQQVC